MIIKIYLIAQILRKTVKNMIVKKIIGIEAKAQTLKILNLGLKERMDHRLNVVTYWYLLERNKIAEHDISFVCASLFGCNTLFLKEIAKTTLQSRIIQKSRAM